MKKIKLITIILLIVLITMVSFFGVYVHVQNRMENQIKDYALDMDLKGVRYIKLKVNIENTEVIKDSEGKEVELEEDLTDEQLAEKGYIKENVPNNSSESLTVENYELTKKIIEERLKKQGIEEYEIAINNENGEILIQIPENDSTDNFVSNINTVGKFEIIDSETKEVLMNNDDIKLANVMYGASSTTSTGTTVYLNIEFNKQGKEKLKNISNTYVEAEESTDTTESKTKEITMKIDDQEIMTTSFEDPIENGKLQLSIGSGTTDSDTLQEYITQASTMASILDSGKLPIQYDIDSNEYILSDITDTKIELVAVVIGVIILLSLIIMIARYKLNGFLSAISMIGLISSYLLIIRYTNVLVSIQGIVGILITIFLNYIFINKILLNIKNSADSKKIENVKQGIKDAYIEFFKKLIPICISIIVFCFISWSTISSFGMIMFWGISLMAIFNYLVTATMLKIKAEK